MRLYEENGSELDRKASVINSFICGRASLSVQFWMWAAILSNHTMFVWGSSLRFPTL